MSDEDKRTVSPMEILALLDKPVGERLEWLSKHIIDDGKHSYYLTDKSRLRGFDRIIENILPEVALTVARNLVEYHLGMTRRTSRAALHRRYK